MNERGKNMGSCMSSADYVNDKNHNFVVPFSNIYQYVPITNYDDDGYGHKSSKEDDKALAETLLKNYKNILKKYNILSIDTQRFIVQRTKNALADEDKPLEATMRSIDFYGSCLYNLKIAGNRKLGLTQTQKNIIYTNMRREVLKSFGRM